MSKKTSKHKYYAIKVGKNTTDKIVTSWDECKEIVLGYQSIYKSFTNIDDAYKYLNSIKNVEKKQENISKAIEVKKKKKSTTVSAVNVFKKLRLDKSLVEEFENKCIEFNIEKEKVITDLIKEWLL